MKLLTFIVVFVVCAAFYVVLFFVYADYWRINGDGYATEPHVWALVKIADEIPEHFKQPLTLNNPQVFHSLWYWFLCQFMPGFTPGKFTLLIMALNLLALSLYFSVFNRYPCLWAGASVLVLTQPIIVMVVAEQSYNRFILFPLFILLYLFHRLWDSPKWYWALLAIPALIVTFVSYYIYAAYALIYISIYTMAHIGAFDLRRGAYVFVNALGFIGYIYWSFPIILRTVQTTNELPIGGMSFVYSEMMPQIASATHIMIPIGIIVFGIVAKRVPWFFLTCGLVILSCAFGDYLMIKFPYGIDYARIGACYIKMPAAYILQFEPIQRLRYLGMFVLFASPFLCAAFCIAANTPKVRIYAAIILCLAVASRMR